MDLQAAFGWTLLNVLTLAILAFYSMTEMACISINKLRLQYYVSKKIQRATWLNFLIQNPAILFGTTLLSVNTAMFIGSECARQTYLALNLNPDLAAITQVGIVVIFGELVPMFAARRFSEHVALIGAPVLYFSAKLMSPILWMMSIFSRWLDPLLGKNASSTHVVLHQDDLRKILSTQEFHEEGDDFDIVAQNIFTFRNKNASQIMQKIENISMLPSNATVADIRPLLKLPDIEFVPLFSQRNENIIGIVYPRDLLRASDSRRLRDYCSSPWFITANTQAFNILKDFRKSGKKVAVVIDSQGQAVGLISLENLINEIFGESLETEKKHPFIIDRSFTGDMKIAEFNAMFDIILDEEEDMTLAELMEKMLGHTPEVGDHVYIEPFELTVTETTLTGIKKIEISN